ncbi:MAG: DNA-directed RNA polymerase subunit beta [candidate division WOR-3 bacterium]|nr:DNA-directed RNA polymerase subunit beta [candidate division WOR-3 bacterium]MDH5683131.1 DNA-directed RNA polymerase subunit beta [candidate division WOR-3 bacterium]
MKTVKKDFSKFGTFFEIPNLLSIQLDSFREFLQYDKPPTVRQNEGLQAIFNEVFPVEDTHRKFTLEFVSYEIGKEKYTPEEALLKGVTYSLPLKVNFRLIKRETSKERAKVADIIEDEVFLCDFPFMTPNGTFIINGVERVIVSQLHRSPGLYFSRRARECSALLVPLRGAWFEILVGKNDNMIVLLDRNRRISAATFLRALGFSDEDIFRGLFRVEEKPMELGQVITAKVEDPQGEIYARPGELITEGMLEFLISKDVKRVHCVSPDQIGITIVANTIRADKTATEEDALKRVYYRLRSMSPHSIEVAKNLIVGMLFDKRRFDLGKVGRFKLNQRLAKNVPLNETALTREDVIGIFKLLLNFAGKQFPADDVDHLSNRRVKRVGELLEDQFRYALMQLGHNIRERAAFIDEAQLNPQELVNTRVVVSSIMKFFTQSQLCQFMEQTNPLTELTHKRRVSALGPGGLTKETAGFEARDVHYSHYGRICPIETPEGPNIGLITTVATFAKVNQFGFLTAPYWKVKEGVVTRKIEYLSPDDEDRCIIAQANTPLDENRKFDTNEIIARKKGDVVTVQPNVVTHMDVSPKQLFAPSTVMIPFLEHDDADRALMGANMQRQAVPLLESEKPLVATGVEERFATESSALIRADEDGVVVKVDASNVVVRTASGLREHRLWKFKKSNQYTCWTQRPVVREGQSVKKGDLLADGPSTQHGQLALGRNVFVAFMPWRGYNYEDAIVVSESLVKDDSFTSIQILEFEIQARETKLGPEEITRDIPGAIEDELKNLDEFGIVRLGTEVSPADILVGRITPKGETEFSPEERLLRAIFGEKAANVRDTSLRVEPGVFGVVIERRISTRRTQDALSRWLDKTRTEDAEKKYQLRKKFFQERRDEQLRNFLLGEKAAVTVKDNRDRVLLKAGEKFEEELFAENRLAKVKNFDNILTDKKKNEEIKQVLKNYEESLILINEERKVELDRIQRGDDLPHGVLVWIRIFIAQKRKLSVGDKMAGRHGNKGVVAKILPVEDMPYLLDGNPVDMVLNPLGVPSRMNIGQILETYLGWTAKTLGYQAICPVFEGATPKMIKEELVKAGIPEDGKIILYDGRTGIPFHQKVVVGYLYMMKLVHMVDDKIHARSTGRYSLITQQPLGGKSQFGGQRFGEMEVWALEAYGAANALQEMLTIKSDDVEGRSALYEALIRGKNPPPPKPPASFSVLIKELQGLGLELIPEKEGK